jgi:DNA-binding transcriptional MerR regulator
MRCWARRNLLRLHPTSSTLASPCAFALISMEQSLPPIPAKRYFTIGEVGDLCGVKPHVLRYWEQEFTQLRPMKRRGNRRYYQHHEVLMIRRIRDLLYEQGFTISGARNKMQELPHLPSDTAQSPAENPAPITAASVLPNVTKSSSSPAPSNHSHTNWPSIRAELLQIRELLLFSD